MPPHETGKRLTPAQIQTLRQWIQNGAIYARHWAYTPLKRPEVPSLNKEDRRWVRNEIDAFALVKMHTQGLTPSPQADRRTLIRRLYFDLLGLPPSPEAVETFVKNNSPDAYEHLVDQLLASPRYGERWARHWLDIAHYADTQGYDKDMVRLHAWPYRDYVIRSLNRDKPYTRFVQEQIAGDVLYPGDPDGIEGLGFVAAGPFDMVGHAELGENQPYKKVVRNIDRDDMVTTVMNVFVSATVQCARCHDHKFDPISQKDYYSLQAVFAAVDRADRSYDKDPAVARRREQLTRQHQSLTARRDALRATLRQQGGETLAKLEQRLKKLHQQAIEGHREFGYHSQIESRPDKTKWVQVDLGRPVNIQRVVLIGAHDDFNNIGDGFGFPVRYRVEAADDADFKRHVTTIIDHTEHDVANPGVTPQVFDVAQVKARYVRVTATRLVHRLDHDYILALGELQVLDERGNNAARGSKVKAYDTIEAPPRWGAANLVDGIYVGADMENLQGRIASIEKQKRDLIQQRVDHNVVKGLEKLEQALSDNRGMLAALPPQSLVYAAATQFNPIGNFQPTHGQPREVHLLYRGSVNNPGPLMTSGTVGMIDGLPARFDLSDHDSEGARRAALAQWITDKRNPLTWRSIVNRVWQYHFGRGFVDTPNDFGKMGATPTHPRLLDYLAATFRDGDQSLKRLHKMIVMSATYRQSSLGNAGKEKLDFDNRFLWRMNRRKIEAEAVRDSVLAVAGKLDLKMGGPGFRAFGFLNDFSPHYKYQEYDPDDPASHRRSIYRFIVRSVPDPFMETLDCADPSQVVAKRLETLTPLQALTMMNNPFMVRMAEHFASRLEGMADSTEGRIDAAYRLAFNRAPTDDERAALTNLAEQQGLANVCRLIFNMNEFVFVD